MMSILEMALLYHAKHMDQYKQIVNYLVCPIYR